jgi:transcriptional regulator with XRE-family HTH domain
MPNGFVKKSVETLTLGEKLKKIRSERRIGLTDIARFTKIQLKYLEDIEEGNYEKLPSDVYVKGFLKSYAKFLGVNENSLIRLYQKERGIKRNLSKNGNNCIKQPEFLNISPWIVGPKAIVFLSLAVLVLAGFFYIYKEAGSFANDPKLIILAPEANATTTDDFITVEGRVEKDAKLFINDQPVIINDEGGFKENMTLQEGANFIQVRCLNRFGKEAEKTLTVHSNLQKELSEESAAVNENVIAENLGQKMELEVSAKSQPISLNIEADGHLIFSGEIKVGEIKKFQAEKSLTLDSNKGNETLIKFNGEDQGLLGEKPRRVKKVFNAVDNLEN